ncbi:MAG: SAM-dependent methyltransferase [Dehalococcoidia bacterium]|nr:SAM-dependent methyltransferase [Dehalococcoidia bacterium]
MFWRKKRDRWLRPDPPERVTLEAIGYVRNDVKKPRPRGWDKVESTIEMLPEHEARLQGIERYSHIIVVLYLDIAASAPEKPDQLTLESGYTYGIFATRSQLRPNHLGVSSVSLLARDGMALTVRGLDAVDGTPVLDIKPYLPAYDAIEDARIP